VGRRVYAIVIRECSKKGKASQKGTEARGLKTTIMTTKPNVSRRLVENLHQAAQGLAPLGNGFLGEGLNEAPNSQGYKHSAIITHTHMGERQY
jgi:hypothetical protein